MENWEGVGHGCRNSRRRIRTPSPSNYFHFFFGWIYDVINFRHNQWFIDDFDLGKIKECALRDWEKDKGEKKREEENFFNWVTLYNEEIPELLIIMDVICEHFSSTLRIIVINEFIYRNAQIKRWKLYCTRRLSKLHLWRYIINANKKNTRKSRELITSLHIIIY